MTIAIQSTLSIVASFFFSSFDSITTKLFFLVSFRLRHQMWYSKYIHDHFFLLFKGIYRSMSLYNLFFPLSLLFRMIQFEYFNELQWQEKLAFFSFSFFFVQQHISSHKMSENFSPLFGMSFTLCEFSQREDWKVSSLLALSYVNNLLAAYNFHIMYVWSNKKP